MSLRDCQNFPEARLLISRLLVRAQQGALDHSSGMELSGTSRQIQAQWFRMTAGYEPGRQLTASCGASCRRRMRLLPRRTIHRWSASNAWRLRLGCFRSANDVHREVRCQLGFPRAPKILEQLLGQAVIPARFTIRSSYVRGLAFLSRYRDMTGWSLSRLASGSKPARNSSSAASRYGRNSRNSGTMRSALPS